MLRIGVTGTNGKSTTCTWIESVLGARGDSVASVRNSGYTLAGQPVQGERTLNGFLEFERRMEHDGAIALVVEVTSKALVDGFADAWSCDVAILTNITHDHLNLHRSMEAYVAAKSRMFAAIKPNGTAILNGTDAAVTDIARVIPTGVKQWTYGLQMTPASSSISVIGRITDMSWDWTDIELQNSSPAQVRFTVPAPGLHFAENALATWCAAASVGWRPGEFADALVTAPLPPGRFDIVSRAPIIVVDFAHSPDALHRTLSTIRLLTVGRLIVVFGAGGDADPSKRPAMGRAANTADTIVLTSDNPRTEDPRDIAREIEMGIVDRGNKDVRTIIDRREAIQSAVSSAGPDDSVLIAGRGDDRFQIHGTRKTPLHDKSIALQALAHARYRKSRHFS